MEQYFIGVDLGSTASKVAVFSNQSLKTYFTIPTCFDMTIQAKHIIDTLAAQSISTEQSVFTATGYGRISFPLATKAVTEITCHAKGAWYLTAQNCTVLDIGGQDTKVIALENGTVNHFYMNDKCSAGTGRFLDIMARTMGITISELFELATLGTPLPISSMCTVFAESEVISHIGAGAKREDVACGIIASVAEKAAQLAARCSDYPYLLTGGLSQTPYFLTQLSKLLDAPVTTHALAQYAGAIGAALVAQTSS